MNLAGDKKSASNTSVRGRTQPIRPTITFFRYGLFLKANNRLIAQAESASPARIVMAARGDSSETRASYDDSCKSGNRLLGMTIFTTAFGARSSTFPSTIFAGA